jgi:hypothetical protein
MIIIGAALANRFYISDGWTREKVAKLLFNQNTQHVIPRIFKENDPDNYFAVYEASVIFISEEVAKHEYRPYSKHQCDAEFSQKNHCMTRTQYKNNHKKTKPKHHSIV